jgi:hypothetical protein
MTFCVTLSPELADSMPWKHPSTKGRFSRIRHAGLSVVCNFAAVMFLGQNAAELAGPMGSHQREQHLVNSDSCAQGTWSAPRQVAEGPDLRDAIAQFPSVAIGPTESFVVGNAIATFDESSVRESPFTALTLAGKRIGRPIGRFNFIRPKATIDSRGRLHALWAEPRGGYQTVPGNQWPPRELSAIWTATFDQGSGWSKPQKIYDGANLFWDSSPMADRDNVVSRSSAPYLNVVAATFTGDAIQPIIWLRYDGQTWTSDSIRTTVLGGPVQPSLAVDGNNLYLTFLAPAPGRARDRNSVFFQRSNDGGKTWTASQLVSRSGMDPAGDVRVIVAANNSIHLLWLQATADDKQIPKHAISRDGGTTWSEPEAFAAPTQRANLRAIVDACGAIHVVWENWQARYPHVRLEYARWLNAWSSLHELFPGWRAMNPALVLSATKRPMLVFVGNIDQGEDDPPIRTLYSKNIE